jgi:hypothetical protein
MRARTIPLLLVLLPQIAMANNRDAGTQSTAEEQPDAELLEFIAEFEPLDGHWIDPIQLNMIFAKNRNGEENE